MVLLRALDGYASITLTWWLATLVHEYAPSAEGLFGCPHRMSGEQSIHKTNLINHKETEG